MTRDLFRFDSPSSIEGWTAIDDRVMGGVSVSRMRYDPAGHAVFEGTVSLEKGGGFASVRSRAGELGAQGAARYALEVLGDGKRYKINLRTDDAFDGIGYQASFEAPAGVWTEVQLPVEEFRPTFRGRGVRAAPPLDPALVRQVGFMIADRQSGRFSLTLRWIRAD